MAKVNNLKPLELGRFRDRLTVIVIPSSYFKENLNKRFLYQKAYVPLK